MLAEVPWGFSQEKELGGRADQTLLVKPLLEPGAFHLIRLFLEGRGSAANEARGKGRERGKEKQKG